jgi:hypothetical protein
MPSVARRRYFSFPFTHVQARFAINRQSLLLLSFRETNHHPFSNIDIVFSEFAQYGDVFSDNKMTISETVLLFTGDDSGYVVHKLSNCFINL